MAGWRPAGRACGRAVIDHVEYSVLSGCESHRAGDVIASIIHDRNPSKSRPARPKINLTRIPPCRRFAPGVDGLGTGDEGRALVYRYVWRDDTSDTFDESVRV